MVSDEVPHHVRVHQDAHGWPLPALVAMTIHVPARARMAARQGALVSADARDVVAHPTLAAYGVPAGSLEVSLAADQLITPLETAKSILFHHPELASIDPDTAAIVLDAIAATGVLTRIHR